MTIYNSTALSSTQQNSYQPLQNSSQTNNTANTGQALNQSKMYRTSASSAPVASLAPTSSSPLSSILRAISDALGAAGLFSQAPQLTQSQSNNPFIRQAIPTDPAAAQLKAAGQANAFNQNWQAMVADAAAKNGGFGNAQDGFLGYSESGFVRHYNPNLSEYQNKRLAEISLEAGFTLEKMPSRADSSGEKITQWVDKFIEKYDTQMAAFATDPSVGVSVKDGRKRFELKLDPASGQVLSTEYKKRGGLAGFVEKNFKYIEPIANAVSFVGNFFPGVGTAVSAIAQGIKQAATMVVNGGKLTWQGIASIASSVATMLPGAASVTGATTGTATAGAAATAGTTAVSGSTVFSGLANSALRGLQSIIPTTGWETLDSLIARGLEYGISQTDKANPNSFGFMDFIGGLFSKPAETAPAKTPNAPATTPNSPVQADDPILEGGSEAIPGATIIA